MTHSFSFEIPPLLVLFSFCIQTPWALILFSNFGCWLWRLGASLQFRFGLEWQAWLATGVFFFPFPLLRLNFTA